VTVGEAPEPGALRTRFKEDILSAARKVPLTVVTVSIVMDDVLALLDEEVIRTSKKKDLGFSDALVFLKSLQYAKEQSIGEYWLVSADMGLDEHALRSVAKRHAVECRLLRSTVEAIDLMKSLRAIDRSSLDSDLPKAALALLQANTEAIRQFLQDHPIDVSQAWGIVLDRMVGAGYVTVMPFPMPGSLSGISMKAVHVDTAVPESIPEDGSVAPIAFRGHAQAEVAVQRQGPPVAARPSPYYGTFLFGPSGMHHFSGTLAVEIVDVPISGRAHAVFRGGAFVAPLTVESVSVATGPGG
jgi:hypothetical protein